MQKSCKLVLAVVGSLTIKFSRWEVFEHVQIQNPSAISQRPKIAGGWAQVLSRGWSRIMAGD